MHECSYCTSEHKLGQPCPLQQAQERAEAAEALDVRAKHLLAVVLLGMRIDTPLRAGIEGFLGYTHDQAMCRPAPAEAQEQEKHEQESS